MRGLAIQVLLADEAHQSVPLQVAFRRIKGLHCEIGGKILLEGDKGGNIYLKTQYYACISRHQKLPKKIMIMTIHWKAPKTLYHVIRVVCIEVLVVVVVGIILYAW
jgi:hypothetical protein